MSKYKVGDVAALFSKPKEATTESGKKLQSLFEEFHSKNKKSSYQISAKQVDNVSQGSEKVQRVSKKEKKRKFSEVSNVESSEVVQKNNTKKLKKVKMQDANLIKQKEKQLPTEQDLPEKKISKSKLRKLNNSVFNPPEADFSEDIDRVLGTISKIKNKFGDKKSSFIKQSEQQRQVATNGGTTKEQIVGNDEFVKKKAKKHKKHDTFLQNIQSNPGEIFENDILSSKNSGDNPKQNSLKESHKKEQTAEQNFPRKKKSKSKQNNLNNNIFNSSENIDVGSDVITKSKNKSADKKFRVVKESEQQSQVTRNGAVKRDKKSSFMKKLEQKKQIAANGKSKNNEMSDKDVSFNNNTFKVDTDKILKKIAKNKKRANFVKNVLSNDTDKAFEKSLGDNCKQNSSEEYHKKEQTAEQDFPRKKKFKSKKNYLNNNIFNSSENIDQGLDAITTSKNKSRDKMSRVVKEPDQQSQVTTNGAVKRKHDDMSDNGGSFNNLFKGNVESIGKKAKKQKKKKDNNFIQNTQLNHKSFGNDILFEKSLKQNSSKKSDIKEQSTEQDFPRKKKSKSKQNNINKNMFNSSEDIDQTSEVISKSENKRGDKKSSFIKKSEQQRQIGTNNAVKRKCSKMPDESSCNDNLFKDDNEFVEKNAKKVKKYDNFSKNTQLNHESCENIISNRSFADALKLNLPEEPPKKGQLDFIKIEELSRTLFVSNLPVNLKKKALKTLFSSFGEVEKIRYFGIETDKAKIFNEQHSQTLNASNYAADSALGFIIFCNRESAVKALSLSGSIFKGRHITVDFALPRGTKKIYDNKRTVFIGNLPFSCQDESVWEAFSECGRIENVRVVKDKETGIGKGFGYVQFSTVQSKENALALKDLVIDGRDIRIKPVGSDKNNQKNSKNTHPIKRNPFKSHAIRIKKKNINSPSRKSVTKIMKKQKIMHEKKKTAAILQKSTKTKSHSVKMNNKGLTSRKPPAKKVVHKLKRMNLKARMANILQSIKRNG